MDKQPQKDKDTHIESYEEFKDTYRYHSYIMLCIGIVIICLIEFLFRLIGI